MHEQEASQTLLVASDVHYAITYVALFLIPLVGYRVLRGRLPLWLKIASAAGLLTSLVSLFIAVYPIVDVVSRNAYATKICARGRHQQHDRDHDLPVGPPRHDTLKNAMPRQLVECVPNFSEGRDPAKIDAIVQAILAVPEVVLLDRESDADHNRCVLTFVGPPAAVADAAFRGVEKAVALIDLTTHQGAHPRIGAADVVPFIPIEGVTLEECVKLAERLGQEIWNKLHVPVYFYEAAARRPDRVNLENIRRGQFEALVEEMGVGARAPAGLRRPVCHPTAGATVRGRAQIPDRLQRQSRHARCRHRQEDRQDHSLLLRRLPLREVDGGACWPRATWRRSPSISPISNRPPCTWSTRRCGAKPSATACRWWAARLSA